MSFSLAMVTQCVTARYALCGRPQQLCRRFFLSCVVRRSTCANALSSRIFPRSRQSRMLRRTCSQHASVPPGYNTAVLLDHKSDTESVSNSETIVVFLPKLSSTDDAEKNDTSSGLADMSALSEFIDVEGFPPAKYTDLEEVLAKSGSSAFLYSDGSNRKRILAVGLGETADALTSGKVRASAAAAVLALRNAQVRSAVFVAPTQTGTRNGNSYSAASWVTHAVPLSDYVFDRHLSELNAPKRLRRAAVAVRTDDQWDHVSADLAYDTCITEGTLLARNLANERADDMNPAHLEAIAMGLATEYGFKSTVLHEDDLRRLGMNMMVAVGQAGREKARLVAIEVGTATDPGPDGKTVIVVGKGITYDSGGLNLKPTGYIEEMHMDMGGAAAVLGAVRSVGKVLQASADNQTQGGTSISRPLGGFTRAVFIVALAENAIDALSYKPHAILHSHKGLSVQVGNTDAEGRLVLADVLSWAQSEYTNVCAVVDVATLTGACVVALGEYAAGAFTNSVNNAGDGKDDLRAALIAAGNTYGECLHPMPIYDGHREELVDVQADVNSTGASRYGGACTAAAFLEKFITEGTPWCHIDIAGPAMTTKDHGHVPKGGTGFGAATLAHFVCAGLGLARVH